MMASPRTGLDRLLAFYREGEPIAELDAGVAELLRRGRLGLITHPAAVDYEMVPSIAALLRVEAPLAALFGPEHGFQGAAAAGEKVAGGRHAASGLVVHSLYGATRRPTREMLRDIDLLLIDLQDVGTRFYTYIATMSLAMEAAAEAALPVVILDRLNPIGGEVVEGPVLEPKFASFVGPHPIPLRHGRTIGELALQFHRQFGVGAEPAVVGVQNWDRGFRPHGQPWAPPSPNIPTPETALLYPGLGLLEGTNLSEGRGTTMPFAWVGAPWIDAERWCDALNEMGLAGVRFRPVTFVPTTSKHAGETCAGVHVHVVEREAVRAVAVGEAVIATARANWPDEFAWLGDGDSFKIDRLAGTDTFRLAINERTGWSRAARR